MIQRIVCSILLLGAAALPAAGGPDSLRARWAADGRSVRLSFSLTEAPGAVGRNYAVSVTPCLVSSRGDTLRLTPAAFRGRRNQRYVERRRYYGQEPDAAGLEYSLGDTARYTLTLTPAEAPWVWQERVSLITEREREGCCRVDPLPAHEGGSVAYVPPFRPELPALAERRGRAGELAGDNPVLRPWADYRPYDSTRILRKERGALTVYFPVDRATLSADFRQNRATLDRIISITRQVMADTTSTVRRVQIIGLASVEGPQARNRRLADARAQALKSYIQERVPHMPDSLFECVGGGEAWTELRSQVEDEPPFEGRAEVLRIIHEEPDPDRRERRIKAVAGGRAYDYLKRQVLTEQRNSGYLQIYYDYVPDTAAAVINRASALLRQEGRAPEALSLLRTVAHDARAWNALGVALYLTGDAPAARRYFEAAAQRGVEAARQNLRSMEATERARSL